MPVTVAFIDDHPMLLVGLSNMFEGYERFKVVASGTCADDAEAIADSHQPDLLIADVSMPGDVFASISRITSRQNGTKILIFTAFSSVDTALKALEAGAAGFVLKGSKCDELFEAIEIVLGGETYVTPQFASQVFHGLRHREQREQAVSNIKLSAREKQIVLQLVQGKTNREIASALNITEKTVKNHMTVLMTKFHARNRVDVVLALRDTAEPH